MCCGFVTDIPMQMATLHQAILSILDIALRFHDTLAAHAGEAMQASPKIESKLHRSLRVQQQGRSAVIRFATSSPESVVQTSDSESDLEDEDDGSRLSYRMLVASQ